MVALRFAAPLRRGRRAAARGGAARWPRSSRRGRARARYEVRDPATGATRPSRAGDVMVLAPPAHPGAPPGGGARGGRPALRRRGRQVVLRPPGGARGAGRAARDRRPLRPRRAGGRAALVVLRRERPRHRGLRALGRARSRSAPVRRRRARARRRWRPALALLRELHERRARAYRVPALLERLYDETRVLAALTGTPPRRGADREPGEGGGPGAPGARSWACSRCAASRACWRSASSDAREEPDLPATRPGDPDTVRILSIHKAKGLEAPIVALYDTGATTSSRAPSVIPLWDEGRVAIGFRSGLPAAGLGRARKPRRGEGARRGPPPALRGLHARARLAGDPAPARATRGSAASGATCCRACRRGRRRRDGRRRRHAARARAATRERARPAGAGRRRGRRRGGRALGARAARALWSRRAAPAARARSRATRLAARDAPRRRRSAVSRGARGGRDFGSLVHQLLEWIPLDERDAEDVAAHGGGAGPRLRPRRRDGRARRPTPAAARSACPCMERARARAARLARAAALVPGRRATWSRASIDLVFEEDGGLVVVDYKTDHIAPSRRWTQAAHHAPQLQLYGRGLAQATGLPVPRAAGAVHRPRPDGGSLSFLGASGRLVGVFSTNPLEVIR